MTRNDREMRPLPLEGQALKEMSVIGNGKDAEVHLITREGRRYMFATSESRLKITTQGTVLTEVIGPDDATLQIRYSAGHLVLSVARIDYPGLAANWPSELERFGEGRPMSWMISRGNFTLVGQEP